VALSVRVVVVTLLSVANRLVPLLLFLDRGWAVLFAFVFVFVFVVVVVLLLLLKVNSVSLLFRE
jgi:hypothetical protein